MGDWLDKWGRDGSHAKEKHLEVGLGAKRGI